jgi:hypothetical protein
MDAVIAWIDAWPLAGLVKTALGIIAGAVSLGAAIVGMRAGVINLNRQHQAKLIQDQTQWSGTVSDFTKDDITRALKHYVTPDCSQTDPANSADIRKSAGIREQVVKVVDRFIADSENRHLLVLADTGMGKTSFCLNYLAHRNRRRIRDQPLNCAVIPLGRPDAIRKIRKIPNPADTILLLDAFDEDVKAIDNSDARLAELLGAASGFGTVIVTCRSQFFKNDLSIPTRTGVAVVRPRRAGVAREYLLETLYLLPFTPRQINQYIGRQFPWWTWGGLDRAAKARALVADIPELSVRPMLLVLLPGLVREGRHIQELFDLYRFMTSEWLGREASWIDPNLLTAVSKKLAVFIYTSRKHRATDRVSLVELHKIALSLNIPEDRWNYLSARSLLNRDSEGNVKFSHRSIMEFYFVLAAIDGDAKCFKTFWSDFMRELFVSWGNSEVGSEGVERAREILAKNLSGLGLSPLSEPLEGPRDFSARAFLQNSTRRQRRISDAWRADSIKLLRHADLHHRVIEDAEFGLIWEVPHLSDYDTDEIHIIQSTYVQMTKSGMSKRLASKAQFFSLLEAEANLDTELLMRETLYWLGDRIGNSNPVVVSVSAEPVKRGDIKLLGQLGVRDRHGLPVWAYLISTQPDGFARKVPIVSAIPMLVSETDNETRRTLHRMSPAELKTYLDGLNVAVESLGDRT